MIRILSCEALKLKVHIQSSEALKLKVCTQSSNALKSSKLSCSFILYVIIMKNAIKNSQFLFNNHFLFSTILLVRCTKIWYNITYLCVRLWHTEFYPNERGIIHEHTFLRDGFASYRNKRCILPDSNIRHSIYWKQ